MTKAGDELFAKARDALMGSPERPSDRRAAAELFFQAAREGSAEGALRSAVFAAEGYGRPQNWQRAFELLGLAAQLGDRSAKLQLEVLAGNEGARDWRKALQSIDLAALLTPPRFTRLTEQAYIGVAEGFAPPQFAPWLINAAKEHLKPSLINDHVRGIGVPSEARTAYSTAFGPMRRDVVIAILAERAARMCGRPQMEHEAPNVISYEPGQQYEAHYDYVRPDLMNSSPQKQAEGQRAFTFVTYLNDQFEAGETSFLKLGLTYKGKPGDAIIWANVTPNGEPDQSTLHAGLPPTSGRKWILSQWIRTRPYPFR